MKNLPTWKQRQKNLYSREGRAPAEQLTQIANDCLNGGYLHDAFEYFSIAQDQAGLSKLETLVIEEGDAFLLAAIEKATGQPKTNEIWNKLGYRALELGKIAFAQRAFEKTANEIMLAKIRQDSPAHVTPTL